MWKKLLGVALVLVAGAGILLADEAKGKVTKWEKGTLTVKVGDKDVEYKVGKDAKLFDGDTEVTDKADRGKLRKGSADKNVVVTYDKDGDKITVTKVVVKK